MTTVRSTNTRSELRQMFRGRNTRIGTHDPENERGFVYMAHEIRNADDLYFPVLGPANSDPDDAPVDDENPANGIALDEIFSYEIVQRGARIDVALRCGDGSGPIIGHHYVDMREQNSGYDVPHEWMFFRAGAYTLTRRTARAMGKTSIRLPSTYSRTCTICSIGRTRRLDALDSGAGVQVISLVPSRSCLSEEILSADYAQRAPRLNQ
ncbi:MAG: hypothetical protein AAGA68_16915 [Pseudomonadota bacterium]